MFFSPSNEGYTIPVSDAIYTETGLTKLTIARPNSGNIYPNFAWFAIGRWK